jgi:hypothetical protein
MAALEVVKRRLDEKGIGQFCLELHSNKSSKIHVLQQLDRVWSSRGELTAEEWQGHAERVRSLRDRINRVVAALHKRWPNGWTIYGAVGLVVRDANPLTPRFSWSVETEHNNEQMTQLRELVSLGSHRPWRRSPRSSGRLPGRYRVRRCDVSQRGHGAG